MDYSIDISRLQKVRQSGTKLTARCPACAAVDSDKAGDHFFLNLTTGQFGCAKFPGDKEHRREISSLVGVAVTLTPNERREWRKSVIRMGNEKTEKKRLSRAIVAKRDAVITAARWTEGEARAESPEQRLGRLHDPRQFLAALFGPDAVVWTGQVKQSGHAKHARRWLTVDEWQDEPEHTVGPMVSPATWMPGTISRAGSNVASAPYLVLDFDGFDGKKPTTAAEIDKHVTDSLSVVQHFRRVCDWQLAALLHTGNKSIHAWFHRPSDADRQKLANTADAWGVDAGLIQNPEHPCRMPGWLHAKTGRPSRVVWLQRR